MQKAQAAECFNVATAARPWNLINIPTLPFIIIASMWPRPRGRGIQHIRELCDEVRSASMWPRPRGRGLKHSNELPGWPQPCFNVVPRPRGRGIGLWQFAGNKPEMASMWPRPRGRGIAPPNENNTSAYLASLWPRPRGRGIVALLYVPVGHRPASMWPRSAARPWNRPRNTSRHRPLRTVKLQRGHGRAAVESASSLPPHPPR